MATQSNEVKIQIADEVIVLTGDDLAQFEADRAAIANYNQSLKDEANAKEAAKQEAAGIAKAKLVALGLTADDLKALGF